MSLVLAIDPVSERSVKIGSLLLQQILGHVAADPRRIELWQLHLAILGDHPPRLQPVDAHFASVEDHVSAIRSHALETREVLSDLKRIDALYEVVKSLPTHTRHDRLLGREFPFPPTIVIVSDSLVRRSDPPLTTRPLGSFHPRLYSEHFTGELDCIGIEVGTDITDSILRRTCPWIVALHGNGSLEHAAAVNVLIEFHESKYATLPLWHIASERRRTRTIPPGSFVYCTELPKCLHDHWRSVPASQLKDPPELRGRRTVLDAEAEDRGFWTNDCAVRRTVMRETLSVLESPARYSRLRQAADANMKRWQREAPAAEASADSRAPLLMVLPEDWGEVTLRLTRRFGRHFAVLNMANAYVPGGAYLEGAVAQEENMFRRTDCHLSVCAEELNETRDRYSSAMTRLLEGFDGEVYFDLDNPRVCFRGREDATLHDLGYRWFREDEIFPFFELRAAASDRRYGGQFDANDCERRIAAQLDTLRRYGIRNVVLGAFGCGAFCNPAESVARIYHSQLQLRAAHFDVVAFAILSAGYGRDSFDPFQRVFDRGVD